MVCAEDPFLQQIDQIDCSLLHGTVPFLSTSNLSNTFSKGLSFLSSHVTSCIKPLAASLFRLEAELGISNLCSYFLEFSVSSSAAGTYGSSLLSHPLRLCRHLRPFYYPLPRSVHRFEIAGTLLRSLRRWTRTVVLFPFFLLLLLLLLLSPPPCWGGEEDI